MPTTEAAQESGLVTVAVTPRAGQNGRHPHPCFEPSRMGSRFMHRRPLERRQGAHPAQREEEVG